MKNDEKLNTKRHEYIKEPITKRCVNLEALYHVVVKIDLTPLLILFFHFFVFGVVTYFFICYVLSGIPLIACRR